MPGAGDLGVPEFVEGVAVRNMRLRRLFMQGLTRIEIAAMRRGGKGFSEMEDAAKDETLREVEEGHPPFFHDFSQDGYLLLQRFELTVQIYPKQSFPSR